MHDTKNKKVVIVKDKMQPHYEYELVAPIGEDFDTQFKPDLTPKDMLKLGVFGGVYMRDCVNEFPKDWFTEAKLAPQNTNAHIASLNYFKINASQPLSVWKEKD